MRQPALLLLVILSFLGLACSDSSDPGAPVDGSRNFRGSIDPDSRTFLLESIDSTVDGVRVLVDLLGSDLEIDPQTGTVSLSVSVRNAGNIPLYAPGEIVIHHLEPSTIWPENADRTECPLRLSPTIDSRDCRFAFDYSALLGDDGILNAAETSGSKRWRFRDPNLVGFSFGAEARFGLGPDRPRIEGVVFGDKNENGHQDDGEPGLGGVTILVNGPDLDSLLIQVPETGHYMFPVSKPGLYNLLAIPPPTFAPVHSTTPNPLQILLPPGPDGLPESYLHADFGFANDDLPVHPAPIGFWEGPEDSLKLDPYALLGMKQDGRILSLEVGYSGCQADHFFGLFMLDGFVFRECAMCPPLARIVLSHDNNGEMCEAYFQKLLQYDLTPILRRYRELYGTEERIEILFRDGEGQTHTFFIGPVTAN